MRRRPPGLGRKDGNVAVEFALVLPVLLIVLAGLSDLGRAILASSKLKSAVRAGLEYAQAYPDDTAGIQAVVSNAADGPAVSVTTASVCECADGTAAACTATCADGTSPGTYMVVAANQEFTALFTAMSFATGPTLSASASIRTK